MRKVWLVKAPVSAGAGAVVQVPTQCWLSGMSYLPIWRGVMGSANLMPEAIPSPSQSAGGPAPPCSSCFIRSRSGIANSYNDNPATTQGCRSGIDIVRLWQLDGCRYRSFRVSDRKARCQDRATPDDPELCRYLT